MTKLFVLAALASALAVPAFALDPTDGIAAAEGPVPVAVAMLPKAGVDKFSAKVNFVGTVAHEFYSYEQAARIAFARLQNLHETKTSGDVSVILILTTDPVTPGDTFSGWFAAIWEASTQLGPGESFVNVDVKVPLATQVPDGIYYVNLGSFEVGPGCGTGIEYCYDDLRAFPIRVQVYRGSFYSYPGPPQPGTQAVAVEYFHAAMGHYFVSADADEIAGLDAGAFAGWARTGQTFAVWTGGTGLVDVCRFFTEAFAPKSSHFYTALIAECDGLKLGAVWQYEKLAFKVALPTAAGACPVGIPLYRLYNAGTTGAPNHRNTTSLAIRGEMIAQGFVPEDSNTVCVAPAP